MIAKKDKSVEMYGGALLALQDLDDAHAKMMNFSGLFYADEIDRMTGEEHRIHKYISDTEDRLWKDFRTSPDDAIAAYRKSVRK